MRQCWTRLVQSQTDSRHATLVSELCASIKLQELLSFNALMANDVCVPDETVLRDVVQGNSNIQRMLKGLNDVITCAAFRSTTTVLYCLYFRELYYNNIMHSLSLLICLCCPNYFPVSTLTDLIYPKSV